MTEADYHDRYCEHSSRLQTWIGGYGAGLASLLVYQFRTAVGDTRELWKSKGVPTDGMMNVAIADMHRDLALALRSIAIAIALQVVLLVLNKASQFALANRSKETRRFRLSHWFSEQYCVDATLDFVSVVLLILATLAGIESLGLTP
jgi:hypothetical protein